MTSEEIKTFQEVVDTLHGQYPERDIKLGQTQYGLCAFVDGEIVTNTEGYNLLYCLYSLTKALKDELL